ncbi:RagB/SusD family nutrient uptake outer membrane protein [Chitinophaga sp.]|uniref:RagB/SusD family nutrient uptake outer membrane protein n=1 Tax=Chitinophaga sp. TaxID=1869181 RepID=UPI002F95746A
MINLFRYIRISWLWVMLLAAISGCRKYLEVPLPLNSMPVSSAFENDITAAAALTSVYTVLAQQAILDGTDGLGSVTGLYTDELKLQNTLMSSDYVPIYSNGVSSSSKVVNYWATIYKQLYSVNTAIEGLKPATSLTYQHQWLGEAYFLRGLFYFYLANIYGEVPLVVSTDYLANNVLARSPQADVYAQVVSDLRQAQSLLDNKYHDATGAVTTSRGRPNRAAATALLARAYLYMKDWKNAAAQADSLIGNTADFQLPDLSKAFLVNSKEVIWGLIPFGNSYPSYAVKDATTYYLVPGLPIASLTVVSTMSDALVVAFEPRDGRWPAWVGKDSLSPTEIYYYAYKYKVRDKQTPPQEIFAVLRLAEQYLVRAEAKAQQNDLTGALADLNAVRARAGLGASTAATQPDVLAAILRERRVELFTETGHRFFDLRRTGKLDAVMNVAAPLKGGSWNSYMAWWPIPVREIQNDPHLVQTPGY